MKKLLTVLGVIGLAITPAITVISCGQPATSSGTTQKLDLSQHLNTQMIGAFNKDNPGNDEILTRISATNPNLVMSEIELTDVEPSQAIIPNEKAIKVKADSKVYKESVQPIFYTDVNHPRIGLVNVIKNLDLGAMLINTKTNHPDPNLMIQKLKELNPAIDEAQLKVDFNNPSIPDKPVLSLVEDNNYYYGVTPYVLNYQPKNSNLDLTETITNQNIGSIPFSDEDESLQEEHILESISDANPYFSKDNVEVLGIDLVKGTIQITSLPTSNFYKDNQAYTFSFNSEFAVDLNDVLVNKNLGTFEDEPTDQQILDRIKELNPGVNVEEIYVASNVNNRVVIREKFGSKVYWEDKITLNYEVTNYPLLQSIGNALTKTNLGDLNVTKEDHDDAILKAVKDFNPLLIDSELIVSHDRDGFATIKVTDETKAKIYSYGSVEVDYNNLNKKELNKVLVNPPLFTSMIGIDDPDQEFGDIELLLKNLKLSNPELDTTQIGLRNIQISQDSDNQFMMLIQAEVYVHKNSKIYVNSNPNIPTWVVFSAFLNQPITNLIKTTNLGSFATVPTYSQIVSRIKELNLAAFDINSPFIRSLHFNLTNNGFGRLQLEIGIPGFEIFSGSIRLTYTLGN